LLASGDAGLPVLGFECGFPNMDVPELAEWKEGDGDDKQTVYGYVPVDAIVKLLEKHGGLVGRLEHMPRELLSDEEVAK